MSIDERASTHVYHQKQLFTKEELQARESLCIHEEPAYCNAACPLKIDVKAIMAAVAKGDFDKAYTLYEKICRFRICLRKVVKHLAKRSASDVRPMRPSPCVA